MAEYIEREAVLVKLREAVKHKGMGAAIAGILIRYIESIPAVDAAPVPQEYAYFTTMDDENYLVDLTLPVSKIQYDAINSGKDLWSVLRMDGDGNDRHRSEWKKEQRAIKD